MASEFSVKQVCLSHEPEVRKEWEETKVCRKQRRFERIITKVVGPYRTEM